MSTPHIRWMIRRDLPEVFWIESESFDDSWTFDEFLSVLRQRNCIGLSAEDCDSGEVIGYAIYELKPHRLEILNLAVDPVRRNDGVGSALIAKMQGKLTSRRPYLSALVRETNLNAQLFLQRRGFRWISTERAKYGNEDAYWMERERQPENRTPISAGQLRASVSRGLRWSS